MRRMMLVVAVLAVAAGFPPADLQPQRDPVDSASASSAVNPANRFFEIMVLNFDLPASRRVLFQQRLMTRDGWEFYDRRGYHCVTLYLQVDGRRIAQVVYRDPSIDDTATYAGLNDRYGNEQPEDRSVCALPIGRNDGAVVGETESKPVGLTDSVVSFVMDGVTVADMVFPATSPRNADTWFEFDEEEATADHVTVEGYWRDDLVVRIDVDRMTPDVTIAA